MKRCLLSSLLWASSLLASAPVGAQDALPELNLEEPCAPEVTAHRSGAAELEGVPALWFHRAIAQCLLGRLQVLPLYVERVRLLEQRLVISTERDALRARQVTLAEQEAEAATGALEAAVRGRREAEEDRDAWYRSPILWFVVGVVVTVVLEVVAVWGFSQLKI